MGDWVKQAWGHLHPEHGTWRQFNQSVWTRKEGTHVKPRIYISLAINACRLSDNWFVTSRCDADAYGIVRPTEVQARPQ